MTTNATSITQSYWPMLSKLSNKVKIALAQRLLDSVNVETAVLDTNIQEQNVSEEIVRMFAGCWEDTRSSDEIIQSISESRSPVKAPISFD